MQSPPPPAYAVALLAVMLSACVTTGNSASSSNSNPSESSASRSSGEVTQQAVEDGEIVGTPAPNSKFKKLKLGMSEGKVVSLIGEGQSRGRYITGKNFIPGYQFWGKDAARTQVHYKGHGRLVYAVGTYGNSSTTPRLIKIIHDNNEIGYQE